jgi:hypothetical protein
MNWYSVQMNAAMIAGVVSFNISLIIALVVVILTNKKGRDNFKLEFAAEGVAREMLMDHKLPYRTFRVLRYHLSGFTDDELRKILVRAGGIRLTAAVYGSAFDRKHRKQCESLELLRFPRHKGIRDFA